MTGTGGMFAAIFATCFIALPVVAQTGWQPLVQVCDSCDNSGCALPRKHSFYSFDLTSDPALTCQAGLCVPTSVDDPKAFCARLKTAAQGQPVASSRKLLLDRPAVRQEVFSARTKPQHRQRKFSSYFKKRALREDAEGLLAFAHVREAPRYLRVSSHARLEEQY